MPGPNLLSRPQPLIGILLVAAGWSLSHQWGSNTAFDACQNAGPQVVIISVIGLVITGCGGLYCLAAWHAPQGSGRRILAAAGGMLALIAGFAIVLQIAAGLILPSCAA